MANKKLTDLTELTTPADNDFLYIVDVSDTTESAQGTSKKIRKDKVDSGASKENIANKQNDLTPDGTGTKYPTVDAVNTIDLQKVVDVGGYAEVDGGNSYIFFGEEDGVINFSSYISDGLGTTSGTFVDKNSSDMFSQTGDTQSRVAVTDGIFSARMAQGAFTNILKFNNPLSNTNLFLPAKTVDGDYTLATTDETVNLTGDQTIEGYKTFQNGQVIIYGGASNPLYIQANNVGAYIENLSTNDGLKIENTSSGDALNINGTTASTGKILKVTNNNVETLNVTKTGNINANSFIKTGGTSTQALMANGSAVQLVTQTITNGVTDKSPSEDAVYDALGNVTRNIINTTSTATVTGTLTETLLYTGTILANSIIAEGMAKLNIFFSKGTGGVGNMTLRVKVNSVNDFATSQSIGVYTTTAVIVWVIFAST